jgi:hypothetical protein
MRIQFMLATGAIAAITATAGAQTALVAERDVARPGGVYETVRTADTIACARLCTEDSICMAWTHQPSGACELKAVVPHPVTETGAMSGLSPRAPDFARRLSMAELAPPPTLAPQAAPHRRARDDGDSQLLGGAEQGDLRPSFGSN